MHPFFSGPHSTPRSSISPSTLSTSTFPIRSDPRKLWITQRQKLRCPSVPRARITRFLTEALCELNHQLKTALEVLMCSLFRQRRDSAMMAAKDRTSGVLHFWGISRSSNTTIVGFQNSKDQVLSKPSAEAPSNLLTSARGELIELDLEI